MMFHVWQYQILHTGGTFVIAYFWGTVLSGGTWQVLQNALSLINLWIKIDSVAESRSKPQIKFYSL